MKIVSTIIFTSRRLRLAYMFILLAAFQMLVNAKPGDLDRSFGTNGILTATFPAVMPEVGGGVLQSDGKMIVVGTFGSDFAIYRLDENGNLDPSFGGFGLVTVSIGTRTDTATAAAIQSDGKIVVCGYIQVENNNTDIVVVRLNANGTLDTGFDGDGIRITDLSTFDIPEAIAIQNDGKIVVAGRANTNFVHMTLIRYNVNGSLDTSFSGDGIVVTQFPSGVSGAHAVQIQPDGKILAAGSAGGADFGLTTFGLARYNVNGTLDISFGNNGTVVVDVRNGPAQQNSANALQLQPDGKIVAAGITNSGFVTRFDFALLRLNSDGSIDQSFGDSGKVITPVGTNDDFAGAVSIQPDGKILAGGGCSCGENTGLALVRYNADGTLDTRFGRYGIALPRYTGPAVSLLRIGPDGRIFSAGFSSTQAKYARFLVNGAREFDYDGDGRSDLSVRRPSNNTWYLQQSNQGYTAIEWGVADDRIAPADYDGDARTDIAVFRPSEGRWYIFMSRSQTFESFAWGADGDVPVPADFNGDGRADLAVYRESDNTWYMSSVVTGPFAATQFGAAGDRPQIGDFDGDGRSDVAVFRPSSSTWYILKSNIGFFVQAWGQAGDIPTPMDFDGDGATDLVVYRPATGQWFHNLSTAGFKVINWGQTGDMPIPADFDGDGRSDSTVFRPTEGKWYMNQSLSGFLNLPFGQSGDVPTQSAFIQGG